jgi:hypothetical protein
MAATASKSPIFPLALPILGPKSICTFRRDSRNLREGVASKPRCECAFGLYRSDVTPLNALHLEIPGGLHVIAVPFEDSCEVPI